MMGKNHIISSTCTLLLGGGVLYQANSYTGTYETEVHFVLNRILDFLNHPFNKTESFYIIKLATYVFFAFLFYYIGSLLPDIDSENSLLGRYFHIPMEHRTWTHTIYFPILILVISFVWPIFFWLFFGIMTHLFWDSLSFGGVCFLNPVTGYRKYGKAKVKKKHILKLYRSGKPSEYVVVTILVMVTIFSLAMNVKPYLV